MRALLLSGGMDSAALAYWLKPEIAITVDYGQIPASAEVSASAAICRQLGIRHEVLRADCSVVGTGQLAQARQIEIAPIPEWWPFRNQLIITLAAAFGLRLGVSELLIGCLKTDAAHADGTEEFILAMSRLTSLQEGGLRVTAPAIQFDAAELIRKSGADRRLLGWCHSCHIDNVACGRCRGCVKHYQTMQEVFGEGY